MISLRKDSFFYSNLKEIWWLNGLIISKDSVHVEKGFKRNRGRGRIKRVSQRCCRKDNRLHASSGCHTRKSRLLHSKYM